MDIVLATNTDDPFLALQDLERYEDGSGFGCLLSVRSGWLTAMLPFSVEVEPMSRFIAALRELDRSLTGEAVLKPTWEEPYVRFTGDGTGRIFVSGELIDYGAHDQRVRFGFATDQTCLSPLIAELGAVAQT